jgi:nicotinate-nucleotide adenylyltransferase
MKVGLLFGSFNPVHSGHVHLAEKVLDETNCDEVWFVISPQNPFKINHNLVDENLRKEMVYLMTENNFKLKTCDIEFNLPRPSYTFTTFEALQEKYPQHEFEFIVGSDALNTIEKWRNYKEIVKMPIIGFIRDNEHIDDKVKDIVNDLTIIHSNSDTSSTFIRNYIGWGRIDDLEKLQLLNKKTIQFIKDNNLYK